MTDLRTAALRLADDLIYVSKYSDSEHWNTLAETAAELRRLHAENEAFGLHLSERMKDLAEVEAQRDALLEALKRSRAQWIHSVTADHCLAAIKAAEENT